MKNHHKKSIKNSTLIYIIFIPIFVTVIVVFFLSFTSLLEIRSTIQREFQHFDRTLSDQMDFSRDSGLSIAETKELFLEEINWKRVQDSINLLSYHLRLSIIVHTCILFAVGMVFILFNWLKKRYENKLLLYQNQLEEEVKKRTEDLHKKNMELRAIYEALPDVFVHLKPDCTIQDFYKSKHEDIEEFPKTFIGEHLKDVFPSPANNIIIQGVHKSRTEQNLVTVECDLESNQEIKTFESRIVPCDEESILAVFRDITQRKQYQDKIKKDLEEREILLKEIHHRVKNNLAIIQSLIALQGQNIQDEYVNSILQDLINRIHAIALVHSQLCYSDSLSEIDLYSYFTDLVSPLISSSPVSNVGIKIDVPGIYLNLDKLIPLGLICSELVTNAFKYGFPDNASGEIHIKISRENEIYQMIISNNGVPFPDDVDFWKSNSLGLNLVCVLVEQIEGTIELCNNGDTVFLISFPA